jgi:hypothetical protein
MFAPMAVLTRLYRAYEVLGEILHGSPPRSEQPPISTRELANWRWEATDGVHHAEGRTPIEAARKLPKFGEAEDEGVVSYRARRS